MTREKPPARVIRSSRRKAWAPILASWAFSLPLIALVLAVHLTVPEEAANVQGLLGLPALLIVMSLFLIPRALAERRLRLDDQGFELSDGDGGVIRRSWRNIERFVVVEKPSFGRGPRVRQRFVGYIRRGEPNSVPQRAGRAVGGYDGGFPTGWETTPEDLCGLLNAYLSAYGGREGEESR